MTKDKRTIAILGAGRWGTHLIRNFLAIDCAQIIAIADPNRDRLQQVSQKFGLNQTHPSLCLTTDWQEALQQPNLEAVVVATPAKYHYETIQAALKQGYHVLAEKPLTLTTISSKDLCNLAAQQQRCLVIDHTYLFHPAVQAGQEVLATQRVGQIYYGYASRTHLGPVRQDVDVLWDLAIHDIAIFNQWLGTQPIAVQAQGTVWLQSHDSSSHDSSSHDSSSHDSSSHDSSSHDSSSHDSSSHDSTPLFPQGLADLVWVTLAYPDHVQIKLHFCWLNPDKQRRLVLVGDRGALIFDEMAAHPLVFQEGWLEQESRQENTSGSDRSGFIPRGQSTEPIELVTAEPLKQVCHHFLDCVEQRKRSKISDGWVGVKLVAVLEALSQSLRKDGVWVSIEA